MGGYVMEVDKKIISKCKRYDKASFTYLFHQYEKYLYNLCYSYVHNEESALDLVQEIYIKVFNNITKFDENYPFHPWIRKIAVNTCLNYKRDEKSNVISMNREIKDGVTGEDEIASPENVEEYVVDNDTAKLILENIKKLPSHYGLIIALRYYEDLSYGEIAETLGKPIGTVKTDIYRAKALLKKSLQKDLEVE
jgi:RNA polymerase sigma-70 factor (ECF subfamily)